MCSIFEFKKRFKNFKIKVISAEVQIFTTKSVKRIIKGNDRYLVLIKYLKQISSFFDLREAPMLPKYGLKYGLGYSFGRLFRQIIRSPWLGGHKVAGESRDFRFPWR
jgi:hypothetical protein